MVVSNYVLKLLNGQTSGEMIKSKIDLTVVEIYLLVLAGLSVLCVYFHSAVTILGIPISLVTETSTCLNPYGSSVWMLGIAKECQSMTFDQDIDSILGVHVEAAHNELPVKDRNNVKELLN